MRVYVSLHLFIKFGKKKIKCEVFREINLTVFRDYYNKIQ